MRPSIDTLNKYHDKKRNLDYARITKQLKNDEKSEKSEKMDNYLPLKERILDGLEESTKEGRR